jgi:Uma2 family endonuclease
MGLRLEDIPHYTYDDYKIWEGKWELINGIPYAMSPSPSIYHQDISTSISRLLSEAVDDCENCKALIAIDWKMSDDTVVCPDNLVICHKPINKNYLTKAPEIIFEILSKSTSSKDTMTKFNLYESEGVKYYILVNQYEITAKIYELKNGKFIKQCDVTDEKIDFELSECSFKFNFKKIWSNK